MRFHYNFQMLQEVKWYKKQINIWEKTVKEFEDIGFGTYWEKNRSCIKSKKKKKKLCHFKSNLVCSESHVNECTQLVDVAYIDALSVL